MEIVVWTILCAPFLWLNYRIILSDLKEKIIPNKYLIKLVYILPLFYIYDYVYWQLPELGIFFFILQSILVGISWYLLFYFWKWWAWDAKYIFILSLFIPHLWILSFLWNIALATFLYLFWYILWFFFLKGLFNPEHYVTIKNEITKDIKSKWDVKKNNSNKRSFFILEWIVHFLILFVALKLTKIYVFESSLFFSFKQKIISLYSDSHIPPEYFILSCVLILIICVLLFKSIYIKWTQKINSYISKTVLYLVLFTVLITFISTEIYSNSTVILPYLLRIFTFYILIYMIIKILFYSYKICFFNSEYTLKHYLDLKEWDYIDLNTIKKVCHKHWHLSYIYQKSLNINGRRKKRLICWNTENFFLKLSNPLSGNSLKKVKNLIKTTNFILKKIKKEKQSDIQYIPILKTFAFWKYIFLGFIITYIFENEIIKIVWTYVLRFIYYIIG